MSQPVNTDSDLIVWVDIETTGLEVKGGLPLELGMLLTTVDLVPVAQFQHVIQWGPLDWENQVGDYVTNMHTASGLRKEYDDGAGVGNPVVEQRAIAFLERFGATGLPMAGSNVANFDRRWIAEFLPKLNGTFHYRNIDISSIKETCRRWNPEVYAKLPAKQEKHRVIADCVDTVAEFRFYLDNFLHATRGPV